MTTTTTAHDPLDQTETYGYALHIGVQQPYVEQVVAALNEHPVIRHAVADGDGWEAWGEAPDEDANAINPDARHIVVFTDYYEGGITAIETTCNHLLVPMRTPRQAGIRLAVTDPYDWSVEIEEPYTSITLVTA